MCPKDARTNRFHARGLVPQGSEWPRPCPASAAQLRLPQRSVAVGPWRPRPQAVKPGPRPRLARRATASVLGPVSVPMPAQVIVDMQVRVAVGELNRCRVTPQACLNSPGLHKNDAQRRLIKHAIGLRACRHASRGCGPAWRRGNLDVSWQSSMEIALTGAAAALDAMCRGINQLSWWL